MSPDEMALLAAIHAYPRDDLPRLVWADYLDEHGEPEHAEFVRLQCRRPYLAIANRDPARPRHSLDYRFPLEPHPIKTSTFRLIASVCRPFSMLLTSPRIG